jgi:hypothetical protein
MRATRRDGEHDRGGNREDREGQPESPVPNGEHAGNGERADQGAELVQRLVEPERPAVAPDLLGRMGEHDVARRVPRGLAHAFEDDQEGGHLPVPSQRQEGVSPKCVDMDEHQDDAGATTC